MKLCTAKPTTLNLVVISLDSVLGVAAANVDVVGQWTLNQQDMVGTGAASVQSLRDPVAMETAERNSQKIIGGAKGRR